MTEQKDHLDYTKTGDTGQDDTTSISPVNDGDPASENTLRRPPEVLRNRTEDIRQAAEDFYYYRDVQQLLIHSDATITWGGTDVDGGTGLITQAGDIFIRPFLAPWADTKGTLSSGTIAVNQITYTATASAYSTDGLNRVTVEHRDGGVGTALSAAITVGPVKRILVLFDAANIAHDVPSVKAAVDAQVALDTDLVGKLTITTSAIPLNAIGILAETRLEGTIEVESHRLPTATLDAVTAAATSTIGLRSGDSIAIWYRYLIEPGGGQGGRRESSESRATATIPLASVFITSEDPSKIPGAIPICTVTGTSGFPGTELVFIDGTVYRKGESLRLGIPTAANSDYAGGPNWADATPNPATTVEGQLDKIVSDLAASLDGLAKLSADTRVDTPDGVIAGTAASQIAALLALINRRTTLDTVDAITATKNLDVASGTLPIFSSTIVTDTVATKRRLLFEFTQFTVGPDIKIRVYLDATLENQFLITGNAAWDGVSDWIPDYTLFGVTASLINLSSSGIAHQILQGPLPASWPDAGWPGGISISGGATPGVFYTAAGILPGSATKRPTFMEIPLCSGTNAQEAAGWRYENIGSLITTSHWTCNTATQHLIFPLHLPHNSTLRKIRVVITQAGPGSIRMSVLEKQGVDYTAAGLASEGGPDNNLTGTYIEELSASLTARTLTTADLNHTVNNLVSPAGALFGANNLFVDVQGFGVNVDKVYGVLVEFDDPGPRNY